MYAGLLGDAREETGQVPADRRIFSLSFRHAGSDCTVEVGKRDPVHNSTVLAILDMGRREPYLVHCGGSRRIRVQKPVYEETEFGS